MTVPALIKTWQFQINQVVAAQGSATITFHELYRVIKNLLKAFPTLPWTCSGSSDARTGPLGSAGMDGIDRWTSASVMEGAAAGSRHAWIVLRQTGVATNYEVCIDFNVNSSASASFIVSPSAGFTGGSVTNRPTATDEIVIVNATTMFSNVDTRHIIHAWQSSDGQCTRVSVLRGGFNQCVFWLSDVPRNPVSGWTTPSVTAFIASGSGVAASYTNLNSTSLSGTRTRAAGVTATLTWSGESNGGAIWANFTDVGSTLNDISGLFDFFGVGLASVTATVRGRHGELFDIYWAPNCVNQGDTLPNDTASRRFAVFGNLIFPWTNDGTNVRLS